MTHAPLTAKQKTILRFILTHQRDTQSMPTIREIGRAVGVETTNGVHCHLRALARKGWLTLTPLTARGLRVPLLAVHPPADVLAMIDAAPTADHQTRHPAEAAR